MSCWSFVGEGTHHVEAWGRQHVDEEDAELGLAPGYRVDDLRRPGLYFGLGLHRLADGETVECPQDLRARRACRNGGDGFRLQQGPLERFGSADIGPACTRAYGDAEADARHIGGRSGLELCLSGGVLNTSRGTTPASNGSPLVASLISSGVVRAERRACVR
jgi:hypothetical protein